MKRVKEGYLIRGKGIETVVWVGPARKAFWILPGELVAKIEATGLKRYRRKVFELRRSALRDGLLVDVGDYLLVTETLVFDTVSSIAGFVMGNSRSGDVAKWKRLNLTGKNLRSKYE